MTIRRTFRIFSALALVGVLGAVLWIWLAPHEPSYSGRPLGVWMEEWNKHLLASPKSVERAKRDRAKAAICAIGTNALPTLLKMVGAKDSAFKIRLIALANKQSFIKIPFEPADYFHARATYGFSALGPMAKPAVPALVSILRDKDPKVRASAAQCLSLIGPEAGEAVPALVEALNKEGNGYGPVLINSMCALGSIHSEPETVVPFLVEYVNGPRKDWNYSVPAMDALGRYRAKAKSAVPAILPYLKDADAGRRSSADAALCAIDPQAAAQALQK